MTIQRTYTEARAHLSDLCNQVVQDRDIVFITRRGVPEVAMIAADELAGLLETAHLLRSPENARRLLTALNRVLLLKFCGRIVPGLGGHRWVVARE